MDNRANNKGTIGNKGGRPSVKDEIKGFNLALPHVEDSFRVISEIMLSDTENSRDRIAAAKIIIEYACGKPKETVDTNVTVNQLDIKDVLNFGKPKREI